LALVLGTLTIPVALAKGKPGPLMVFLGNQDGVVSSNGDFDLSGDRGDDGIANNAARIARTTNNYSGVVIIAGRLAVDRFAANQSRRHRYHYLSKNSIVVWQQIGVLPNPAFFP
jgi:hypothetical protein